MRNPKIPGGYILICRKVVESEIWEKPPLYIKVWFYLLTKAQHSDFKKLKRGQLFASIPEIIEACSWKVGYRRERPTKDQIYQIIDWLRKGSERVHEGETKATMITTTKATHGLLINIDNYDYYQTFKNYEGNKESNDREDTKVTREQRQPNNINKNVKECNEDIYTIFEYWKSKGIINHKSLNEKMKSHINARVEEYELPQLLKAIDNYDEVLKNDSYYWTHAWTLQDFMKPNNVIRFLDSSKPFYTFKVNNQQKKVTPVVQRKELSRNDTHIQKMKEMHGG
jgi:hypothetical protein